MKNVYVLAKTWRYLMIIPAILLFLLIWSAFIFGGGSLDMPFGAWMFLLIVSAMSGSMIYFTLTSKIVTSPLGIEHKSYGIQVWATWDNVEKIEFTQDGFVNLHFKESIYTNGLASALCFLFPFDKIIPLSSYTGDLATSKLLKDLANHVPNSNIPEFAAQQKYSVKPFQEAGVIGLYYLGWFMVWFLFGIGFEKNIAKYLATLGLPDIPMFVGLGLIVGLFVNTMILLRTYNAEIIKLDEIGIAHKARAYYLSPLVIILINFVVYMSIWTFLPKWFDVILNYGVMSLIGALSLPISSRIERLLFRDSVQ